jgi:putative PIN family toxin of toxin-antitoxin system
MNNRPYQVILDTNVLFAALRSQAGVSNRLLSLLGDPRWQIHLSVPLVLEYEEVLYHNQPELGVSIDEIDRVIDALCAIGIPHDIFFLWRPLGKDPDDEFLVELAIAASADAIISYNKVDLKQVQSFGMQVLTPKQFLQQLGELS